MTMRFELKSATGRGAAYIMTLGETKLFMSYGTVIGIETPGVRLATAEHFSKSTAKHRTQLGIGSFPTVPDEEFQRILTTIRPH
jgi:hypothetical protein